MKLSNYFLFVMTICFIFVSGCSLFDSGSGSKYSNSGTTPLCEEGQTLTTVGGTQTCVNNDLLDSTCTKDSDCGSSEYCNKDATPYVCTAEPCMLDSDCPQNDPIWGAMVCNKTSVPNRCVDANGDGCVVITTNGQTTSNCGIAQYCDNTHGHPYACKAQPCTGDAVCQKCDSGMTCNTVGGYKINTRPNNSTYEYVCNLAPYVHICKVQELTPPPSGGCTTDADCTASALGQKCLAGTAPRKCGCNAPSDCTNCTSGHFCRVSTHACQTPPTNECTVGTGPRNAATCTAGQQFQTWDDCDDIYFGCDQYFCNDFVDTEYRKCQIRVYATGPGSSVCTKQYQCFSGWCFYAPNQNPTANVPYPYPTTLGYCRALKSDGSLGLCINENCNSQGGQCTGTTTTCAGIGQKCTNSSGSIICTCDSGVNKCRLNYGELCSSTDQCKTPGVCHTICLQANLGLGASCTTTDQCQANMTCKDGICKGNNGFLGCGNDNTKCVSGICENLVKPTVPGYYCVGHQAEACTGNFPPQTSGGLYTQPYYEGAGTQCIHGVCEDGYCGIRPSGPCLYYNSPIGDYCRHYTGTPGLGNNCWQLQGSWYCN